jgi:hypothetical protein
MISNLLQTSGSYPLEAKGKDVVVSTFTAVIGALSKKPIQEEVLNSIILNFNAILILVDEAKDLSKFIGLVGDILIEINEIISASDKLTTDEKEQISTWLIHLLDSLKI